MTKKTNLFKFLILVISWLLLPTFFFSAILQNRKEFKRTVHIALQDAVEKDYHKRYNKELNFSGGLLGRKLKGAKITNEQGTETIEFKDSMEEEKARKLIGQYVLATIHSIQPDTFNLLFKKELAKYGITAQTGIVYSFEGEKQYSNNDSTILQEASVFKTPFQTLDIKRTVGIQAWIKISIRMILQNMKLNVAFSIIAYFIGLIWVTIYIFKKEPEDENKIRIDRILINKEAEKVYVDGKELKLRKGLYRLLLLFVESPDYTLTKEKICQHFWPLHYKITNNYNNLISSFRREWINHSGCKLITNEDDSITLLFPSRPSGPSKKCSTNANEC